MENGRFSGRLWPDWGNTAWAVMARLGSKGLKRDLLDTLHSGYKEHVYRRQPVIRDRSAGTESVPCIVV